MSEAADAGRRNHVELAGTVVAVVERRSTPAGTPVLSFRLRVEGDPADAAAVGCEVPVVCLGREAVVDGVAVGRDVAIVGALTERRWKGRGGIRQSRFEILARRIRVL